MDACKNRICEDTGKPPKQGKSKLNIVTSSPTPFPKKRKADSTTVNFEPDFNIQSILPSHLQGNLDISGNGRVVQLPSGTFELTTAFQPKAEAKDFWALLKKKIGQMRANYKQAGHSVGIAPRQGMVHHDSSPPWTCGNESQYFGQCSLLIVFHHCTSQHRPFHDFVTLSLMHRLVLAGYPCIMLQTNYHMHLDIAEILK